MTAPGTRKDAARKAAFARRKAAHASVDQIPAQDALRAWLAPHRGRVLAGYMPIRTEIDPLPVMAEMSAFGRVVVPVIDGAGQPLRFRQWRPGCDLVDGPFGARVPADGPFLSPDVLVVPLVAFNPSCHRLGYGGGFYDRTLEQLRGAGQVVAAGFAFAAQRDPAFDVEHTDQRLDLVVTETGLIRATG